MLCVGWDKRSDPHQISNTVWLWRQNLPVIIATDTIKHCCMAVPDSGSPLDTYQHSSCLCDLHSPPHPPPPDPSPPNTPRGIIFMWWGCCWFVFLTWINRACQLLFILFLYLFLSLWPFQSYFIPYFSWQFSALSLCSSSLISALSVHSTV